MSERAERLASWLVDRGYAEARRGYGHADGETLAEALIDASVLRSG